MLSKQLPPFLFRTAAFALGLFAQAQGLMAADLPPDLGTELPASAARPAVVTRTGSLPTAPAHALPAGYTLATVATAPLVTHPIMGCVDDRGRLFIGDAVGVNWTKAQLEKKPPNRILVLEDDDQDGVYDRSTVFADAMTFPQGAAWLDGSLYVCSPPGLWKLTDTNGDSVADRREMIVGGFDYTGNAADVHGPKVHPNGRLYWCHGRKGHRVTGKEGKVVHEGKASGIWSCLPDGSDVQWHSLGCADNPTGLAFTPQGDILGTCNLYHSNPRGDTLMHWLYGGVYERADQMQAIAGLPRTLETMPVVHNFGHVAVSGCTFAALSGQPSSLQLYVTHFNTQRLVRMDLTPAGSTFKAVENEFLKINDPDVHLTDVIADHDGSLLVLNTGGWFRIGCPASLMAKPDLLGSIYRIRSPHVTNGAKATVTHVVPPDQASQIAALQTGDAQERRRALAWIAQSGRQDVPHAVLLAALAQASDPALEHAALLACSRGLQQQADALAFFRTALGQHRTAEKSAAKGSDDPYASPALMARILKVADLCGLQDGIYREEVVRGARAQDAVLFKTAMAIAGRDPELTRQVVASLADGLPGSKEPAPASSQGIIAQIETFLPEVLSENKARELLTAMLVHHDPGIRQCALRLLAGQSSGITDEAWLPPLERLLADSPNPLLLEALGKLKTSRFDDALQALAADARHPLSLRLKALAAAKNVRLTGPTFVMVKGVLADPASSAAARIQAAGMIAAAPMTPPQQAEIAPLFAALGPVETKALLPMIRRIKEVETARALASALAKNPAIVSQQESHYRTAFSDQPPDIFEAIVHPAYEKAGELLEAKKRQLAPLADRVTSQGRAVEGKKHFEAGKGTCIACHKVGALGRALGPDLSKIGSIRTARDLLESILFPSNTLARDYEAHILETRDGQTTLGVIRSHTAEGLLIMDVAGQEKNLAHDQILSDTTLTTSLMPMGLDATLPEQELLDLVAYLQSLK